MKGQVSAIRRLAPELALAVIVAAVFGRSLGGTFVYDDTMLIRDNPHLRELRHLPRMLTRPFWDLPAAQGREGRANLYYRPLVTLSLMVDHAVYGLDARGYHLTNILLQLAVVLLFFRLARRLLGPHVWAAWIAAVLFAVHPSRAEAVCWISGRSELLLGVFFFAALLLFWRAMEAGRPGRALAGAWICAAAALVSKETAVALAVVVPALDLLVVAPEVSAGDRAAFWRRARWCHLPLIAAVVLFIAGRLWWQAGQVAPRPLFGVLPWVNHVMASVTHYLDLLLRPYQPNPVVAPYFNPQAIWWPGIAIGLACTAAAVVGFVAARRRAPRAAWALLLAAATLAPVANLFPLTLVALVAERFLYLPLAGLALLVGLGLVAARSRTRRVLVVAVGGFALTWAGTTVVRSGDFRSPLRFWAAAVAADPQNPVAHKELSAAMAVAERLSEAESHLALAFRNFQRVGHREPLLELQLQLLELRLARRPDRRLLEQARGFLERLLALAEQPPGPEQSASMPLGKARLWLSVPSAKARDKLRRELPRVQELLGDVLSRLGRDRAALGALQQAITPRPRRWQALMSMGLARARALDLAGARRAIARARAMGVTPASVTELEEVLRRVEQRLARLGASSRPATDAAAQLLLAEIQSLLRAPVRTVDHLRRAVELDPDQRAARASLAVELAGQGDLDGALEVIAAARRRFGAEPGLARLEQRVRAIAASKEADHR